MLQNKGFQLNAHFNTLFSILHIIITISLIYICSLMLVYEELDGLESALYFQIFGLFFFAVEFAINLATVKVYQGRKLTTIREIWIYYWHSYLLIDVINILILVFDLSSSWQALKVLRLFILAKMPQSLERLERLETEFNTNIHK